MAEQGFGFIFSKMRAGETVLVEYTSVSSPEILLYVMEKYCRQNDIPMIIDDAADTLPEFLTRLELIGLPIDEFSDIPIIKIGGHRNEGNIIGKIDIERYSLDFQYYNSVYENVYEKVHPSKMIYNPVLGIYKLFLINSIKEYGGGIRLLKNISKYVGNKTRIAFYFVNKELMQAKFPELFYLFEEIATSVMQWERSGSTYKLKVIKSANNDILEKIATIDFEEIKKM
ncbi:hypothetical protein E3E31_11025 [Thermococcus sp. M39]|uniref:DUF257 family protein n=1 Tax=unclassified Thermococcus TaxID=2627626 RepID=UPI001439429C|nr:MULTISPECIES: DUF257 family protein [unclassified Thermococcus]NJE09044.1 hypothetical protein [Thermococcus sp. M39]NJE13291.1 hypothetical protein [Thermococcus sp. LS2]